MAKHRYVVRVIGPSGMSSYLSEDMREVEESRDAEKHSSRHAAEEAADEYARTARFRWQLPPITNVVDLDD